MSGACCESLLKDMDNVPLRKRYLAIRTPAQSEADWQRALSAFGEQRQRACAMTYVQVLGFLIIAFVLLYSMGPETFLSFHSVGGAVLGFCIAAAVVFLRVILLVVVLRGRLGSRRRLFAALGPLPESAYRLSVASTRKRYLGE